jgi:hypothetical protein
MGLYDNIMRNKMSTAYFLVGVGMIVLAIYLWGIKETVTENGVEKKRGKYPGLFALFSIVGAIMIVYHGTTLYTGRPLL